MVEWVLSRVGWWLGEFGGSGQVVLPTEEYFPKREPEGLLEAVAWYADLEGWTFELEDESEGVAIPEAMRGVVHDAAPVPARTRVEEEEEKRRVCVIPYSQRDLEDPALMLRVLACGVSHHLLQTARGEVRREEWEAMVEVGAVMLGFGVILANTTSSFSRWEDGLMTGWRSWQAGVLGDDVLGYALAVFITLIGEGEKEALRHLEANAKAAFKVAMKELARERRADVERLRAIEPRERAGGAYR